MVGPDNFLSGPTKIESPQFGVNTQIEIVGSQIVAQTQIE